jgi:hypothetical protein
MEHNAIDPQIVGMVGAAAQGSSTAADPLWS